MKVLFVIILASCFSNLLAQTHDYSKGCNVVQFVNKENSGNPDNLTPYYSENGFALITNQVYDFIIDGNKHFYSLLLRVEADHFVIATKWESGIEADRILDSMSVSPSQEIQIRMLTINQGRAGLPIKTKPGKYTVSIVPASKYCFAKYIPVRLEDKEYIAHQYFTAYADKMIRVSDGRAWFIDERGKFPLAKK